MWNGLAFITFEVHFGNFLQKRVRHFVALVKFHFSASAVTTIVGLTHCV
jgi:hypothetical protein